MSELKPCPFCGEKPLFVKDDTYGGCSIFCDCRTDFTGAISSGNIKFMDKVIKAWNTRLEPPKSGTGKDKGE